MNNVLSTTNYDFIKNVTNINMENYSITVHETNKKGEGYMGEVCFVSLTHKTGGGDSYHYIIKQAFCDEKIREAHPVRKYFLNEIRFYEKVWPCFKKFQSNASSLELFNNIPRCFGSSSEPKREKLLIENLKSQGFQTYDRTRPLDDDHTFLIMKQFGKFHAISFAYKALNPQEYQEITKDLEDGFVDVCKQQRFREYLKYMSDISLRNIDPRRESRALIEKCKPYLDNLGEIFCHKSDYRGDNSVVLHGDCGSHNLMFKYDDSGELVDMRLIDFQRSKVGTPVFDLSNCFFSGVYHDDLDHLEIYLKVYHDSLSETLGKFGLTSTNIYTFEMLRKDWKEYCQTGFVMGLLMWRMKLTYEDNIKDLTDLDENNEMTAFETSKYDVDLFNGISRGLILHMFEHGLL